MTSSRVSPDRTVRDEIALLTRLGFEYLGTNSAGHHLLEHPEFGRLRPMSSTPRNPTTWRRAHRREVSKLMGLNVWQWERLVRGQPIVRSSRKRRQRPSADKQPLSLLTAPEHAAQTAAEEPPQTESWACARCPNVIRPGHTRYWEEVGSLRAEGVCVQCWSDRVFWKEGAA